MIKLKFKGEISYIIKDDYGNIIKEDTVENLVTNSGIDIIIKCLTGEIKIGAFQRLVLGTNSTPELPTDSSIKTKLLHANITPSISGGILTFKVDLPKGSVLQNTWIREMGLAHFNGTTETLITRVALSSAKEMYITPNNTLSLTYKISILSN